MGKHASPRFALAIYLFAVLGIGGYFALASVQGDFGLFRRVQLEVEIDELQAMRDDLAAEVDEMSNKTHRLSDTYLDLDLLDEQARKVLGYVRADEVVIN